MNGTLSNLMQRLLGVEAAAGEGTAWSIEFHRPWPPWVTFVLVAAVAIYTLWLYFHECPKASRFWRMGLAAVRLAILAVVLVMISQATLLLKRTGLPYVAVLIDDSQSMSVVDRYDEKTEKQLRERLKQTGLDDERLERLYLAKSVLLRDEAALLRGIGREHKLRLYSLTGAALGAAGNAASTKGDGLQETIASIRKLQPLGRSTRLGEGVETVLDDLRGSAPAAIILLSDGVNTEGPGLGEAAAAARQRSVPLFTVGIGDNRPLRDLKISDLLVDEVVFVDDVISFEFKLAAAGFKDREVEVRLTQEGKPDVLASKKLKIEADGKTQTARMQYRPPQEGEFRYRVEVLPLEGELQTDNNALERTVRVRKEKIRVLLAAGYPNYEFRYLRNMLARDNTMELGAVLQDADIQAAEYDAAALSVFPVRREELFSYDVIILDDVETRLLGDSGMKNIAEFVTQPAKGGALVFICGPRNLPNNFRDTPLADLMPVKLGGAGGLELQTADSAGFIVQPTDLGLANPAMQLGETPNETLDIWRRLPPLYWMLEMPDVKMGARVLAVNPDRFDPGGRPLPLICLQYVGAGKVLWHATDETWRWRWRAGDTLFARYWLQMIRDLARSKLFGGEGRAVLSADRREYRGGEPVRIRLRFSDPRLAPADERGVTVIVEQQGRQTRSIELHRASGQGLFEGVITAASPGKYHAWLSSPSPEKLAPAVDFEVLPPVGEFENVRMDAAALAQAAEETKGQFYSLPQSDRLLKDLPPGSQTPVAALPPRPLWNRWPLLLLLLGLLIAEWIGRKMKGMV